MLGGWDPVGLLLTGAHTPPIREKHPALEGRLHVAASTSPHRTSASQSQSFNAEQSHRIRLREDGGADSAHPASNLS
nr:hypothetical protein [Candidatus Bathyarchaeota archaeon]